MSCGAVDLRALDELAAMYSQASFEVIYERTLTGLERPPRRERWVLKRNGDEFLREVYPLGGETEYAIVALATDGRAIQSEQHAEGWDVFNQSNDGDFSHAMEYVLQFTNAPAYDGLRLTHLTEVVANDATKVSATREISFDMEFGAPPEDVFDPANYGVVPSPRHWNLPLPWMFAGLSAVCILLAVWLRRRA